MGGEQRILGRAVLVRVEATGRDLEEHLGRGHTVLAHEDDVVVGIEGDDGDHARVADDVADRA